MLLRLSRVPACRRLRRGVTCRLPVLCLLLALSPALGEAEQDAEAPHLVRTHQHTDLFGIRRAAFHDDKLAVLATPSPGVFLFEPDGDVKFWGTAGDGPAELRNPGDVFWIGDRVLVWDFDLLKLASYDADGELKATRRFAGTSSWRLAASGRDTLVSRYPAGNIGTRVVRQAGSTWQLLATLSLPAETVTLRAEGSPSLTRPAPYSPLGTWTSHATDGIVVWDGESQHLEHINREGEVVGHLPLPTDRYPVTRAEREGWVDHTLPSGDFAGRGDIFKPLREVAAGQVSFPEWHPVVYELISDPAGGVWVRRTPSATSEAVWVYVDERGPGMTLRFPAWRELLAVSATEMAVKARDAMEVELIEIYRRPQPGGGFER